MDIDQIKAEIANIDEMFDKATGWGSWMSSASKRRKHLVIAAGLLGHDIPHKHETRIR